jgi:hypothetical protein
MDPQLQEHLRLGAALLIILIASAAGSHDVIHNAAQRDWWVFPKQHTQWLVIQRQIWTLSPALLDAEWRAHYRMSYETYLSLVEDLRPYIEHEDSRWREAIPVDKAVAMVLYRLAFGVPPNVVANMFGAGKSTVIKYTDLMTEALSNPDKLARKYISIPSGQRLRKIIADFREGTGFENMVGAIDGSHIKLFRKPSRDSVPAEYWSRHDIHSVLVQGICDYNKGFWDVCCKAPGGTHDATHLRSSGIWKKLRARSVLQEPMIEQGRKEVQALHCGRQCLPSHVFSNQGFQQ